MPKAAIYDPYLDTLGGGERYTLTVVETLLNSGYQVDIFWSGDPSIIAQAEARFNLQLAPARIVPDIFQDRQSPVIESANDSEKISRLVSHRHSTASVVHRVKNFFQKVAVTRKYDIIFYVSDWSVPFLFGRKNLLHVQVPFSSPVKLKEKLLNWFKLLFITKIICNSQFTLSHAQKKFGGKKCQVIYPPVDVDKFSSDQPKQNIILTVGRFDNLLNAKKQDVLIQAFIQLHSQNPTLNWQLVLAGGSLQAPENNTYLLHLQSLAANQPISFLVNPAFGKLKATYETAKIYWHAAGFGVDSQLHPENTEHFGMAPVEAMSAGLVPVLVNQGGLGETIEQNISGYLWHTPEELVAKTQILISSPQLLSEMSRAAVSTSGKFSKSNFSQQLLSTLSL